MSQLDRAGLISQSNYLFPDNTTAEITPSDVRQFNQDLIDSLALTGSNVVSASYALTASYAENVPGFDTGSLLTTASVTDATITFTKGDATTFDITIDNPINSTYAQNTITTGKNLSGGEIQKGTPLYFTGSGTSGNLVGVYPADAGNPERMPAGGIAGETIADEAEGIVLLDGYIGNVNTTGFDSGDKVYVGVGGGYTKTAPTGSALIQFLGNIEKGNSTNGSGVIQMLGEERGLPNLTSGYAWVGDGNGVPQAVSTGSWGGGGTIDTGSFATTGSNSFVGDQTITSPSSTALTITSGVGDTSPVIIEGGPDYITKFTDSSIRGINIYGGNKISGSWGQAGSFITFPATSGQVGIYNANTGSAAASYIVLGHSSGSSFVSQNGGFTTIQGNPIQLQALGGGATSVQVTGNVTGSTFTGSFVGDGSGLTFTNTPAYTDVTNTFTQPQIIDGDTEITASSVSSQALKVWDGGYTDGGTPFPILQTYSSNDRAASGTAVEVAGGILSAPGLSAEPLDADTYPLSVTDAIEPRITVYSQNDAAASNLNIELNGNTAIGGVGKNVTIEAAPDPGTGFSGSVQIIGESVSIQSGQPITVNSAISFFGATFIGAGIYSNKQLVSFTSQSGSLGNNTDNFIIETPYNVNINVDSLIGGSTRTVKLLCFQSAPNTGSITLSQGTGSPNVIFGPSGSFTGGTLTTTQAAGAIDYFEITNLDNSLIITKWLQNLTEDSF